MLTRTNLFALALVAGAIGSTACVLTTSNTDGGGGTGGTGETVTSGTTATTTGVTTATTTATATTSTTGGGCVDQTGTGRPESACDQMAAFPATCASDQLVPLAVQTCHKGFGIYESGAWENLQDCFNMIAATTDDTCVDPTATNNVTACLTAMYAATCSNQNAITQCDAVNTSCTNNGETFDDAACKHDLNPFSDAGINTYLDCINAHSADPCSGLHSTCFDEVTSF